MNELDAMRDSDLHHQDYISTIYDSERRIGIPLRWLLFVSGMALVWGIERIGTSDIALISFSLYGAANVLLSYVFYADRRHSLPVLQALLLLAQTADLFLATVLVYFTGGVGSELYLLYCLLAFKSILYYALWPPLIIPAYAAGPLYALALYNSTSSFYFLLDSNFVIRYGLLFGTMLLATYLGWVLRTKQQWLNQLGVALNATRRDLESRTDLMKRTAQDLGNRVMELRSLQEGVTAINSSLTLGDVLRLIVDNASGVLGGARCAIALLNDKDQVVTMAASDTAPEDLWHTRFELGQGISGWVVQQNRQALIGNVRQDPRFIRIGQEPISSIMSVPLVSDNQPIGTLSATSPHLNAFTSEDLSRLQTFADQATIAVKNSRLYQSLSEKSTELEAILRGIGDGVLVTDPDINLLMINPVAARIFQLADDLPSKAPVPQAIPNEVLLELLNEVRENRSHAVREIIVANPDNPKRQKVYQGLAAAISTAEGDLQGIVTVLRDITSQKELEQMKSNFLSVVSHELRTPLHSIKGFVDIILMGKTGEVNDLQKDFLGTVKQQTEQLQTMISNLLESSRLEAGQVKLRISETSVAEIAERVVAKLGPLANDKQVTLATESDGPLTVEADQIRLEQVITNLVDNAIKFTPREGAVTVKGQDWGDEIKISVIDTGIGISPENQVKLFDRFYQVDSGSTRSYKGTGLGLNICRHIIEHHNGHIWVESEEGQGSTFAFVIPKKLPETEMALDFTTLPSDRT